MSDRLKKSLVSAFKFAFWTGVAALIQYASTHIGDFQLPEWSILPIGAALKGAATWIATKTK